MNNLSSQPSKPSGILIFLFKLPVFIYRLRLGWVFGDKFLMLTHVGRKTGRIRRTVLEVIRHNKSSGENIVVSAYGIKADWYRNILLKPALEIRIGKKKFIPIQRLLAEDEAYDEFIEYERLHPFAVKNLSKLIGIQYDGSENGRKLLVDSFRMVSFRPRSIDD